MDYKTITTTQQGGVGIITLNREERMNSWTGRMHHELRHAFADMDVDGSVRAIVLTGAGERAFCAGGDFRALEGHVEKGGYDPGTPTQMVDPAPGAPDELNADIAWLMALRTPVIAAVNGAAAGVGLALACFADIRFVRMHAKFTTAHGRLNLPAEYGLSWLLPRMIGLSHANDLLLSSRIFTGEEGTQLGLFNRCFESGEEVREQAIDYAAELARTVSPNSAAVTKRQVYLDLNRSAAEAVNYANAQMDPMMKQADYRAGLRALRSKEDAEWSGD